MMMLVHGQQTDQNFNTRLLDQLRDCTPQLSAWQRELVPLIKSVFVNEVIKDDELCEQLMTSFIRGTAGYSPARRWPIFEPCSLGSDQCNRCWQLSRFSIYCDESIIFQKDIIVDQPLSDLCDVVDNGEGDIIITKRGNMRMISSMRDRCLSQVRQEISKAIPKETLHSRLGHKYDWIMDAKFLEAEDLLPPTA